MLCDECKKNQATVRLVAIVDGKRTERNLCGECMAQKKLHLRADGMQSMLSAIWNSAGKHPGLSCSGCGLSYDEFLQNSRLGCAQCYVDFRSQVRPLISRLNGRERHAGRVPERADESIKAKSRMEQLRREMEFAVVCEDFEQAAQLRDEIRALTAAYKGGEDNG